MFCLVSSVDRLSRAEHRLGRRQLALEGFVDRHDLERDAELAADGLGRRAASPSDE